MIARILGLAGHVAELIDGEVSIEVRSQVNLVLVSLQGPELFLLQARAVGVDLEAERLGRQVLELAVDQTDLPNIKGNYRSKLIIYPINIV